MGLVFLGILWAASILTVLSITNYYKNPRSQNRLISAVVFLGFLFPLSITFVLPIDVSSARYHLCLDVDGGECVKPFLFVPPVILDYIWLLTYWNSFLLTWLIVPFIQGYVDTGEFGMLAKAKDSIRSNLKFHLFSLSIITVLSVYLFINTSVQTLEAVIGFIMALGNAWGLTLVLLFLGHGLIQLPRALWKSADHKKSLSRLEYMAPKFKELLMDAQSDLDEVISEIQALHRRPVAEPSLHALIDELLSKSPLPEIDFMNGLESGSQQSSGSAGGPLTREYLVKLNYRVKEAVAHRGSSESKWNTLVRKAIHLQDVITNERFNSGYLWTSSLKSPHRYKWFRFCQWLWYVKVDALLRRILGMASFAMSCMVLWSEASLISTRSDYSIINWIIHWKYLSPTAIEFFTLAVFLYLAICTYSSFMKVRIFRYYLLVPHHSDEKSLLFFAAYLCRLAFPLGYNFLTLIEGPSAKKTSGNLVTEFSKVMGPMDLIPILGKNFNYYFSIGLVIVCILVSLRMHGWISQLFSSDPNFTFDDFHASESEHLSEGRELIGMARRQEERSRNRSNDLGH